MGRLVAGDVVVLPFLFSDLTGSKRRPALVWVPLAGNDVICCMITSHKIRDPFAVSLTATDFSSGTLRVECFIRPSRIFTADIGLVERSAGSLTAIKLTQVKQRLSDLLDL